MKASNPLYARQSDDMMDGLNSETSSSFAYLLVEEVWRIRLLNTELC